jgi:hypothetical protein
MTTALPGDLQQIARDVLGHDIEFTAKPDWCETHLPNEQAEPLCRALKAAGHAQNLRGALIEED